MEFSYNNAPSTIAGVSPSFTNKRYHSNITIYPKCDITSFWTYDFIIDFDKLQCILKVEVSTAQQHYQKSADECHFPASNFKIGDKVFVKAQFFRTTWSSKKLSEKYLRLYKNHFSA